MNTMPGWLRVMRPMQWTKNVVVLAGLVFSGNASNPELVIRAALAFIAFCLVSSSMYVFNDWHDRAEDRLHPVKNKRPIASGAFPAEQAIGLAIALLGASLVLSAVVSIALAVVVLTYALLTIGYTLWLRAIPLVDVLAIAAGFVLRALAGTVAVEVSISIWLFVCTLLLALTLGLGKRAGELSLLRADRLAHRSSLRQYATLNMNVLLLCSGCATMLAYLVYTLVAPRYDRDIPMLVTAPFVAAALARYLWLVIRRHRGSAPEKLIFEDRPLATAILAWSAAVALVLAS